jgi:hypothetical protein
VRIPAGFLDAHPDNPVSVSVAQHVAWARKRVGAADDFPLTDETIRAVATRLGYRVGLKRCSRIRHRLAAAGVIQAAGSYRRRGMAGGHRVSLWRVARSPRSLVASVRRRRPVKPRRRRLAWFETVLGSLDGRPPPGLTERAALRMTTLDDLFVPGSAAA